MLKISEKTAIISGDKRFSFAELSQYAQCFAELFEKSGKHSKIAIFAANSHEWAFAFYGAVLLKSTVIPIDEQSQPADLEYILKDVVPDIIFTTGERRESVDCVIKNAGIDCRIITSDDVDTSKAADFRPADIPAGAPDDIALIVYTSGTSGTPKGVMLSYRNILYNVDAVSKHVPIYSADRNVMVLLPLHHAFPLMGSLVAPVKVGATVVFAEKLNAESILHTLSIGKIGIIIGVPRLYELLAKGIMSKIRAKLITRIIYKIAEKIGSQRLSKLIFSAVHKKFGGHLDYLVSGGAALPNNIAKIYKALGFYMLNGYGMTETGPMISFTRPGEWKIGYVGKPLPGIEVITDESGEVCVRGDNVMPGYYNRPEETAEVIRDGWLHTGDTGVLDKFGLQITGRVKDIIVTSNGKNINPEELEFALLKGYPCIKEIGVFSKDGVISAVILPNMLVIREKGILSAEEAVREAVVDFNRKTASYKHIMKFYIVSSELPKTKLGKLQRFLLEPLARKGSIEKNSSKEEPDSEIYRSLKEFITEETGIKNIAPDAHFEIDLGMDSLTKVSLIAHVENTFGVALSQQELDQCSTLKLLSARLENSHQSAKAEKFSWREILINKLPQINIGKPSWIGAFTIFFFKNLMHILYRMHGSGAKNLPKGACIMVANHRSIADGPSIASLLPQKIMRRTYFLAKAKHWQSGFAQFMARHNNIILIDVNQNITTALQHVAAALTMGKNVVIFPEGTRSADKTLNHFKESFAIISTTLNVPIQPIVIRGSERALAKIKGHSFIRPCAGIFLKFLEPIYPKQSEDPKELRDRVEAVFREEFKDE